MRDERRAWAAAGHHLEIAEGLDRDQIGRARSLRFAVSDRDLLADLGVNRDRAEVNFFPAS